MNPPNAPRCFGLPTMFGADAAICGICACHDACGPAAKAMLAHITEAGIDVGNVGSMHVATNVVKERRPAPKSTPSPAIKKSKLAGQILKAAANAHELLSGGINPFTVSTKPPHLKPLVDIMLSDDGSDERLLRLLTDVFGKSQIEADKMLTEFRSALETIANENKEQL